MLVYGTVGVWVGVGRRQEKLYKRGSMPMVWARDSDKEGIDGEGVGEVLNLTTSVNNLVHCRR
jgi:hypothetical protein